MLPSLGLIGYKYLCDNVVTNISFTSHSLYHHLHSVFVGPVCSRICLFLSNTLGVLLSHKSLSLLVLPSPSRCLSLSSSLSVSLYLNVFLSVSVCLSLSYSLSPCFSYSSIYTPRPNALLSYRPLNLPSRQSYYTDSQTCLHSLFPQYPYIY